MVKGIGVDILDVGRMKKIIERDVRFVRRIFTPEEIRYCSSKAKKEQHYAARFTAKEAFFKALGTGWRSGMKWRDVWVVNDKLGKPEMRIGGKTREIFKKNNLRKIHLTVSHSRVYAVSLVVIE